MVSGKFGCSRERATRLSWSSSWSRGGGGGRKPLIDAPWRTDVDISSSSLWKYSTYEQHTQND